MTSTPHERTKRRRELWQALTDFIQSHGGWVMSSPTGRYLRIDVAQGSSLPVRLAKTGYCLRHAGMTTRIGNGFVTVDIGIGFIGKINGRPFFDNNRPTEHFMAIASRSSALARG